MTIEEWNEWLWKEKGVNVQMYYNEFLVAKEHQKKTLKEFIEFVSMLTFVSYQDLIKPPKKQKSRGGSNKIVRARGYIIKAILKQYPYKFTLTNIYFKIFGFKRDHSTASHHRDTEFFGDELKLYQKIENYIKTHDIQWEH